MRIAIAVPIALLLAGCGPAPDPPTTPAAQPAPAVGWNATGEARSYDATNLWDAINGAADGYLAYGFVGLTVQDYSTDGATVTVEIYDQGSALGAFGVYRRDRPPEPIPLAVGAEALITSPHHCAMLAGAHYVQARAIEGQLDEASCRGLFLGLLGTLPGPHDLPAELLLLPVADRVAGSEGFTKTSFLGLSELSNCLHAEYRASDGKTYQLFAFVESAGRDKDAIWSALEAQWKPVDKDGVQALHRSVPYKGEVVAIRAGTGIFGISAAGDLEASLATLAALVSE
jgi:hypothetical protein